MRAGLLILLVVLSPLRVHAATGADDYAIVPGVRIGVLQLGIHEGELASRIKRAHGIDKHRVLRAGGITTRCWDELGLCAVFMLQAGRVVPTAIKITTTSPRYRTKAGVRVGQRYSDARRLLGNSRDYNPNPYGAFAAWLGLEMSMTARGVIDAISVLPAE